MLVPILEPLRGIYADFCDPGNNDLGDGVKSTHSAALNLRKSEPAETPIDLVVMQGNA